jgi:hypothetical protein
MKERRYRCGSNCSGMDGQVEEVVLSTWRLSMDDTR